MPFTQSTVEALNLSNCSELMTQIQSTARIE